MTTNEINMDKHPELRERIETMSRFIPIERINSALENHRAFLDAMVWETPRPDDAVSPTALDLSLNLHASPGRDPERLHFHTVWLTDDEEGEGVVVEGCHGDGKFHCYYYEDMPTTTMTAADIEAQDAAEKGSPE